MFKQFSLVVFVAISILAISGCKLSKCDDCFTPPNPIAIEVVNSNNDNLVKEGVYSKDSIKLYYYDNQEKKVVPFEFVESAEYEGIMYSSGLPWLCIDNEKIFYLYLNHTDTDTLDLLIERNTTDCCTSHPIKKFEINGKDAEINPVDYAFIIRK